jgi:hypothetical protein
MVVEERKYPDSITTDNGKTIRLSQLKKNNKVRIHGHNIKVGDIPLTAAQLNCGHVVRGIALQLNDVVFCDKDEHREDTYVSQIISG